MTVSLDILRAAGVVDNGCKEYPDMPICPQVEEATGHRVRCDDPFCNGRRCAFKHHERGRARWLSFELDLENWSA